MKKYRVWLNISGKRHEAVVCPAKIFGYAVLSVIVIAAVYKGIYAIPSHATTLYWKGFLG